MAHQSRMKIVLFDTPADKAEAAVDFWSAALGADAKGGIGPDRPYVKVGAVHNAVDVMVQQIDGPPRIHVDIETDDLEAEVERLEKLGARRVQMIDSWWVMEAPSGHVFCVVPIHSNDFPAGANRWG